MNYKNIEDNKAYDCIKCGKKEMREELVGNDKGGWVGTGTFTCDDCGCSYKTDTDPEFEAQELKDEKIALMATV